MAGGSPKCGGKKHQGGGTCTRPAGWGTDHPGYGRCKLHGGCVPSGRKAALDAAGAELEALRRIRSVVAREPVEPVAAADALAVGVAIGEAFARMREAAGRASSAWALGFTEGELARLLLALADQEAAPPGEPPG